MWKIRTGDTERIYKEKRTTVMVDTAVAMMVDLSGSMNQALTQIAAILASEAVLGVNKVKLQIAGFTTGEREVSRSGENRGTGRSIPLLIPLFKGFDERGRKPNGRLGALHTSGYTPLGEAFGYGFESLLDRRESRKVLWIITDGEPSFPTLESGHNDYLLMAAIYRRCKAMGIEVVGMQLGADYKADILGPYTDVMCRVKEMSHLFCLYSMSFRIPLCLNACLIRLMWLCPYRLFF